MEIWRWQKGWKIKISASLSKKIQLGLKTSLFFFLNNSEAKSELNELILA